MSKVKEGQIKTLLFEEAQAKHEHRKRKFVKNFLLEDAEKRIASVLKEAMPRGAGQSTLKNSGWNTVWDWSFPSARVDQIRKEIEDQFGPYFYNILQGRHQPVKGGITISNDKKNASDEVPDGSIYFRFAYRRAVAPLENGDPAQQAAYKAAQNALTVLDETLGGFKGFKDAIESGNIPLQPFYYSGDFGTASGGLTEGRKTQFNEFILNERQRHAKAGGARTNYYRQHEEMLSNTRTQKTPNGDIPISKRHARKSVFANSDIPNIATFNDLFRAISAKSKDGYTLNAAGLTKTIQSMIRQAMQTHNLDGASQDAKVQGYITTYKSFYTYLGFDIMKWFAVFEQKGTAPTNANVTLQELRIALAHLTKQKPGSHRMEPDQFELTTRVPYYSNGWDSSPNRARQPMLTLPPLRQLPDGEVRYDRGNGNMGYDHLTSNWHDGVAPFLNRWGSQCAQWYNILSTGKADRALSTQSPEAFEAAKNVFGNRTSAENVLDVIAKSKGDWNSFKQHHLDKSFYSEIRTVYGGLKALEAEKQSGRPSNRHQYPIQPGQGSEAESSILQQIDHHGASMKQHADSHPEFAAEMFDGLNKNLIALYASQELDWDTLTLALKRLNDYKKQTRIQLDPKDPTRAHNWVGQTKEDATSKMDAQGFEMFRKFGYQTAKMMDFLFAVMARSCKEQVNTREDGTPETFYGHQYSGSSGKGSGGEIILSVRYAFSAPELSRDPEVIKRVRREQSARHIKSRDTLQRQTEFPQNAAPTGRFTDPNDPNTEVGIFQPLPNKDAPVVTIVENIEYFLGQAAGKRRFAKTIRHGLPWKHMIDQFMMMYPEVGDQLGVIFDPMNADLQRMELSCKRAIDKVRQGIEVHYTDDEGTITVLSSDVLDSESIATDDDAAADIVETPSEPWTENYPPPPVSETPPTPVSIEQTIPPVSSVPDKPPGSMEKPMPAVNFVGKTRNKDRRLLRSHYDRPLGSIQERLVRSANRLDEIGENKMADKIDVLLFEIQEDNQC